MKKSSSFVIFLMAGMLFGVDALAITLECDSGFGTDILDIDYERSTLKINDEGPYTMSYTASFVEISAPWGDTKKIEGTLNRKTGDFAFRISENNGRGGARFKAVCKASQGNKF